MRILQRQLELDLVHVHAARVRLLMAAVYTLLRAGKLSLTSLGRAIAGRTSHKHGIKRIDRMLGNVKLHAEHVAIYRALARRIVRSGSRPVILVDWTAVTPKLWALVAAVPFEGRAVVVYGETHPISRYQKPYVHSAFLRRLKHVLPSGCVPVIVTDAGFRTPFMRLVEESGWDYVIRLRGIIRIRKTVGRGWARSPLYLGQVRSAPTDFGRLQIGGPLIRHECRLVGIRGSVQHRLHYSRAPRHGSMRRRARRAAHEPWLLATSLAANPAQVIAIYRRRMQIEETFRDAKSTRFGFALSHARTNSDKRANVLLLVASLAHVFALAIGSAAESARLHWRFQANTVRSRRVVSLAMLGRLVAESGLVDSLDLSATWATIDARAKCPLLA